MSSDTGIPHNAPCLGAQHNNQIYIKGGRFERASGLASSAAQEAFLKCELCY